MNPKIDYPEINLWTVAAIAIVAYSLSNMIHEGVGHGVTAVLLGAKPALLNAVFFQYDEKTVLPAATRWIAAGGTLANLSAAVSALGSLNFIKSLSDSVRYFLWFFAAINLLSGFAYFMFSGLIGVGDWVRVITGIEPQWLMRVLLVLFGALLYFMLTPKILAPYMSAFLGENSADKEKRCQKLTLFPYLIGGVTFVLAGLPNPYGLKLVLISAVAASFGGTSLLAWYPFDKVSNQQLQKRSQDCPLILGWSSRWIVLATITLAIFIGILGKGIYF